jgi:hypothetical protein
MLENPHAGDDLGCGGGSSALQALLHRLHKRGNAARAHILQTARAQRPGPGGQLAQLAVLVVTSDGLDLRGIPVQTGDKVSPGVLIPYRTYYVRTVRYFVADPGCLSRIPDPTFFHPGSRIRTVFIPDPGSASNNLSILTPKKLVSNL